MSSMACHLSGDNPSHKPTFFIINGYLWIRIGALVNFILILDTKEEILLQSHRGKWQTPDRFYKQLFKLAIAGTLAFWVTTFVISLLPFAADYRSAFSISYIPMILFEYPFGGLVIGCFVSFILLRFFEKIPTKNPLLKSEILSFVALVIAIIIINGAANYLVDDSSSYFLIGAVMNVPRFLILGIAIGYLYKRLYGTEVAKK